MLHIVRNMIDIIKAYRNKITIKASQIIASEYLHLLRLSSRTNSFILMQTTENNSPTILYYILLTVGDLEGRKHHKFSMKT